MKSHRDTNSIASTSTTATNTTITSASALGNYGGTSDIEEEQKERKLEANALMCYHCFDVLVDELLGNNNNNNNTQNKQQRTDYVSTLPDRDVACPLFVTWDKSRDTKSKKQDEQPTYDLRGCIGTLSPKALKTSIGEYALTSALRDKRFHPVAWSELPMLRVAVSLLVQYEECESVHDWIIGLHGILIRFTIGSSSTTTSRFSLTSSNNTKEREYSATYLPEVAREQGWDQITTITSLIKKAGYHGPVTKDLLKRVHCTRYQSSKHRITFQEYMQYRGYNADDSKQPSTTASAANDKERMEGLLQQQQQQRYYPPRTSSSARRISETNSNTNVSTSHHHSTYQRDNNNNNMTGPSVPPAKWNTCNNL